MRQVISQNLTGRYDNINDAKRHFCSWMRKAYTSHAEPEDAQELPPPSYEFNGGFGGQDV